MREDVGLSEKRKKFLNLKVIQFEPNFSHELDIINDHLKYISLTTEMDYLAKKDYINEFE